MIEGALNYEGEVLTYNLELELTHGSRERSYQFKVHHSVISFYLNNVNTKIILFFFKVNDKIYTI